MTLEVVSLFKCMALNDKNAHKYRIMYVISGTWMHIRTMYVL